jgi:hypothetical protein
MTTSQRIAAAGVVATIVAAIIGAVVAMWKPTSTTNSTVGDQSPIVNGNRAPVAIGK